MTIVPVVERELRAQARLPVTFNVRVLGGAVVLGAAFYFSLTRSSNYSPGFLTLRGGEWLFSCLASTLFCAIWVIVPLMASDSISREQREGTLGLLFLTPLRSWEIVLAKGLVHWLRATTVWLAALPVLLVPFLMGGVSWKEAVLLALTGFSNICWALSAGLMASAACKSGLRSLVSAMILGFFFLLGLMYVEGTALRLAMEMAHGGTWATSVWEMFLMPRPAYRGIPPASLGSVEASKFAFAAGFLGVTDFAGCWSEFFRSYPARLHVWLLAGAGAVAVASAAALVLAVLLSAWRLTRGWQDEPPPVWVATWELRLSRPVLFVSHFRRWLRRKLERNPIGWLETRTWTGRMISWSWFGVTVSLWSLVIDDTINLRVLDWIQNLMSSLLLSSLALSAAGSFRRERETGMMELLLVSPLTESQIIRGRLRGLWGQFLPALVALITIWIYWVNLWHAEREDESMVAVVASYAVLPVVGLYFSLRRSNFLTAFLLTLVWALLIPAVAASAAELAVAQLAWPDTSLREIGTMVRISTQLPVAAVLLVRLHRDLVNRNFSYQRAVT
jgi:ABC-type transport system involved in multi-copper enzyme maturation permease subunit